MRRRALTSMLRRVRRMPFKRRFTLGTIVALLTVAAAALAYWSTTGSGSATGSVGTLSAPTISSATPGAGTVALSWSAVSAPGSGTVKYYVSRDGAAAGGDCPTSSSTSTATSCTDSGLSAGSYSYTVTAVYQSWTAKSTARLATVGYGALDHFAVSAATATPTAAVADNLTITAKDASNITVASYTGSHNLVFSGASTIGSFHPTVSDSTGTATNFGSAAAITFTSGVSSVSASANGVMRLYKAETANVTVTEGLVTTPSPPAIVVSPASANSLSVSGYPSSTVAGTSNSFAVTALDEYGNTATGYTGTVQFSVTTDAQSVLPANYTFLASNAGTKTFNATLKTVAGGAKTLTATDTSASTITGSQTGITVTPASANSLSVAGYPSSTVAGTSHSFTVTALDTYGNTATGYRGTVHVSATNDAAAVLPADYTFAAGDNGSKSLNATFKTVAGGTKTLTATDTVTSTLTANQSGITVTPASAASLSMSGYPSSTVAGASHSFTLTAFDTYGNTATGYNGTVHVSATNDAAAVLPADYTFAAGDNGSKSLNATFKTVAGGTKTLTATDTVTSTLTANQSGITVTPASAASLSVTGYPSSPTAGISNSFTVRALDAFGNTAPSYTGTAHFTSSDSAAVLPANYTFTTGAGNDNGVHTFSATLRTAGSQSITATDTVTGTINGSQTGITVNPASASTLSVTGYPTPTTSGVSHSFTVTAKDQFGNVATSYMGRVHVTSSDANALLPADYTFTTGTGNDNGTHTFSATLKRFGSQSITATDTVTSTITGNQAGVVVTASQLVLSAGSTTPAPGATDGLTITAEDVLGDTATNYAGDTSVTFGGASNAPNGTRPTVTNKSGSSAVNFGTGETVTFASGVANTSTAGATGQLTMTLYDAQTASILVSDGSINNGGGLSLIVSGPALPASNSGNKYTYKDNSSPTADTINAGGGVLIAGDFLQAVETAGTHVGTQYTSLAAPANGGVAAFNVDNATSGVSYKFAQEDQWGNLSSYDGPYSYVDTK